MSNDPTGASVSIGLGNLERAVLDTLWDAEGPQVVRDVLGILTDADRPLAYTTVQTVLEKLVRKGWAHRQPSGRGFAYIAASSREQTAARLLHSLLRSADEVDAALLHFVGLSSDREQQVLRRALTDDDAT